MQWSLNCCHVHGEINKKKNKKKLATRLNVVLGIVNIWINN